MSETTKTIEERLAALEQEVHKLPEVTDTSIGYFVGTAASAAAIGFIAGATALATRKGVEYLFEKYGE